MTDLFNKQAEKYVEARPDYPAELYIGSSHRRLHVMILCGMLAPGVARQRPLAEIYKNVVGTDTSQQQLSYAPKLPNIHYVHTAGTLSVPDLHADVAPPDSVDLVTVAQAVHFFDLPLFYEHVRSVLSKPGGILAVWCCGLVPSVDPVVDAVFSQFYNWSLPYWAHHRKVIDDEYRSLEFPFEPVETEAHTGPFEFVKEKEMDLNVFLTYIRSWSAYQTAKDKGVEMLPDERVAEFRAAWGCSVEEVKAVRFSIFLRMGKIGA